MKTQPIQPARIDFFDAAAPLAIDFADVYHSRDGALPQSRHVFLGGNLLPQRWQGRERFVVLETGFGLGNNFLATWDAWRLDPKACRRLTFVSIEKHPPTLDDLRRAHVGSPLQHLADPLVQAWPALTHNLHALDFESGRVRLLLAFGDVADWLPELVAHVDAFYLDGFAPSTNPEMWDRRIFKGIARLAASGATASTWSVARTVLDGFEESGFVVERVPGFGSKPEMSAARYDPAFTPRRAPARLPLVSHRDAIVIGAGLAGAWTARALTEEGVFCTLIDQHGQAAEETSGNVAGLFHGIVTPEDGAHARFNRAAALHAQRLLAPLLPVGDVPGPVPGRLEGLLRLNGGADAGTMQAMLDRLGLPADYVRAADAAAASTLAGVQIASPAWFYPGGGWLSPIALTRQLVRGLPLLASRRVQSLKRVKGQWQAIDEQGRLIAQASCVVLANAGDAPRLLGMESWPLQRIRGQITQLHMPGTLPRLPVTGAGYAIDVGNGQLVCGATNQPGDDDAEVRDSDHSTNLAHLAVLLGRTMPADATLTGRVGWRLSSTDRLPVLGPLPSSDVSADDRLDQPRFVPRAEGLFTLTALGSRGITWSPLAARTLAAWIVGAPLPLEASLLDAVDAARFVSRAVRRPADN